MTGDPAPIATRVRLTGQLVRRHQTALWRYLRYLGCDPTAADDLLQETFVAALRNPPEDRGDAAFGRWLRTAALNLFRNQGRRPSVLVPLDEEAIEATFEECARDDAGESYLSALRRCLQELTPTQRRAIDIRYREGGGRVDVAAELGLREVGVKTLLRRARRRLMVCVERRLDHETAHEDRNDD